MNTKTLFQKVYGFSAIGILITMVVSGATSSYIKTLLINGTYEGFEWLLLGAFIVQMVLLFVMSSATEKHDVKRLSILSVVFAILEGLILSPIIAVTSVVVIMQALVSTLILFAVLTAASFLSNIDTSKWGNILMISTFVLIGVSLFNVFIGSSMVMILTSWVTLIIFSGWLMYDTQFIKNSDGQNETIIALNGAINIYLDLINMFVSLLRIFSNDD